jgi:hypothetical protein
MLPVPSMTWLEIYATLVTVTFLSNAHEQAMAVQKFLELSDCSNWGQACKCGSGQRTRAYLHFTCAILLVRTQLQCNMMTKIFEVKSDKCNA